MGCSKNVLPMVWPSATQPADLGPVPGVRGPGGSVPTRRTSAAGERWASHALAGARSGAGRTERVPRGTESNFRAAARCGSTAFEVRQRSGLSIRDTISAITRAPGAGTCGSAAIESLRMQNAGGSYHGSVSIEKGNLRRPRGSLVTTMIARRERQFFALSSTFTVPITLTE